MYSRYHAGYLAIELFLLPHVEGYDPENIWFAITHPAGLYTGVLFFKIRECQNEDQQYFVGTVAENWAKLFSHDSNDYLYKVIL